MIEELGEHAIRLHPLVREYAERTIVGREAFAAVCAERMIEALEGMGRLHAEVAERGVDAVIADLRAGEGLADAEGKGRFARFVRPLDRESHCLRGWGKAEQVRQPGFFLQQLRNRCFEMGCGENAQRAAEALRAAR